MTFIILFAATAIGGGFAYRLCRAIDRCAS